MKHHTSALFTGLWGGNVYKSGHNGEIETCSQTRNSFFVALCGDQRTSTDDDAHYCLNAPHVAKVTHVF